ncbi:phosphotransferase [Kordia sp. YSTF-M3]|uniref:Phosphotransferase n=1 Tax=Kordia aestuariivivens TaxID=2759037 RepID=A0ABR7QDB3_9FLAO|nr:phosphotransferase [Kordia aestuariivivens]MBC8756556.1 phosphotransferase [Kordia aestuariivivens]
MKEIFPTHKSTFTGEGLKKNILSEFNLSPDCECVLFKPGLNDTYKVLDNGTAYYLRVYPNKWRTKNDIESELKLINHLDKSNIQAAIPIKNMHDEYIMEINASEGVRYAVLFESAKGKSIPELNVSISRNYGKVVASIHEASDKMEKLERFELNMEYLLDTPLKSIQPFLKHREADFNFLQTTANALSAKISEIMSESKLDYGVCHGDFHYGNIFSGENDEISVFDFDCFGYGWRAYDISVFLWSCVPENNWEQDNLDKRALLWKAFLDGYLSLKPLSEAEIKAAYVFVAIRHIWLLGIHVNGVSAWGTSWIHDKYFDEAITFIKKWIALHKVLD